MRPPSLTAAAGVALALALAASCGVPTDHEPRALPAEDVPFGLLGPRSAMPEPTTVAAPAPVRRVPVFLVAPGGRLRPVDRRVVATEVPTTMVANALRALLEGPTEAERAAGVSSGIPAGTRLRAVTELQPGVVLVDLSEHFTTEGLQGLPQITAVAQVVFTATGVEPVAGVRFAIEGEPRDVPRGAEGGLTDAPLGRHSFPQLEPQPAG